MDLGGCWILHRFCLPLDGVAGRAAQCGSLPEIHVHSQKVLQLLLQGNEIEEANRPTRLRVLKVDQDIEVTFGAGLPPEPRAVEVELLDGVGLAEAGERLAEPSLDRLDLSIGVS